MDKTCIPKKILGDLTKLAPGIKSSEFIIIVGYFGYIVLSSMGILTPGKIAAAQTTATSILDLIQNLVNQFGDQTLAGGLIWAYLKRRYGLKQEDLDLQKLNATVLIEKYKAITALKK